MVVFVIGILISNNIGVIIFFVVRIEVVEELVIIFGNIEINIKKIRSNYGILWNFFIIVVLSVFKVFIFWIIFINIIVVVIINIVFK